jgi:hypothetical protein
LGCSDVGSFRGRKKWGIMSRSFGRSSRRGDLDVVLNEVYFTLLSGNGVKSSKIGLINNSIRFMQQSSEFLLNHSPKYETLTFGVLSKKLIKKTIV